MHRVWKKTHKYNAKKVKVDGIKFDSKKEANRYFELKMLERAGKIKELKLQPKFLLQDGFVRDGEKYRAIFYIADFEYIKDGKKVVEDVKGVRTQTYKLKKKMFLKKYPQVVFKEI